MDPVKSLIPIVVASVSLTIAPVFAETTPKIKRDECSCAKTLLEWSRPGFHLTSDNIDLLISGQLNQDMIFMNDGNRSRFFYGDNDVSASTLRFTTTAKLTDCFKVFSIFEIGIQNQTSRDVSQINPTPHLDPLIRIGEVGMESKCWGKISLGHGYTATDYTAEVDLSGTDAVNTSAFQKMGGGLFFSNGSLNEENPIVKQVIDNLDGLSRKGRLRYDTPDWKGFKFSASIIERSNADIALRYNNDFEHFKFAAAIGYASSSLIKDIDDVKGRNLDGSASILFNNGFNITVAGGNVFATNDDRDDPNYGYIKIGYQFKCFHVGRTNTAIYYGAFDHYNENSDRAKAIGIAIVQSLVPYNADIYFAANQYRLYRSDDHFHPINLAVIGMRVKF